MFHLTSNPHPQSISPRRPPARRAFNGLAGSPLARVVSDPTPSRSDAERQRLFRERRGDEGKKQDAERKAAERAAKDLDKWVCRARNARQEGKACYWWL